MEKTILLMQVTIDYLREIGHPDAEKDAARVEEIKGRVGKKKKGKKK